MDDAVSGAVAWTSITSRPAGLDDGDDNTQLSEGQVESFITNGTVDLFAGSTLGASSIATEAWVGTQGYLTTYSETDPTLASWAGTSNITTVGTIGSGTWNGTPINSTYIEDGTVLLGDLAQNSCTDGQVVKWNNASSSWECAADASTTSIPWTSVTSRPAGLDDGDDNTQLSEAEVETFVTNGIINLFSGSTINSENIASQDWVTSQSYLTNYTETDPTLATWVGTSNLTTVGTIGAGTWNGDAITSTYIADGTITFADLAQNGCTDGQVMVWNGTGSAWECGDVSPTGGSVASSNVVSSNYTYVSDITTASPSYATITGSDVTIVKATDSSDIKLDVDLSFFSTGTNTGGTVGVSDGTTDYDFFPIFINPSLTHKPFSGTKIISGLPAGTYTFSIRWLRDFGSGTFTVNADDTVILTASEVNGTISGASSLWTDVSTYIYPNGGKTLGDPVSAGSEKLSGIYLGDSSVLGFGTDNDILFNFSGNTLNVANNLWVIDPINTRIGINMAAPSYTLDVGGTVNATEFCLAGDCITAWPTGGSGGASIPWDRAYGTTDESTTSTTFVDMPDMSITTTTGANPVEITFSAGVGNSTSNGIVEFRILVDGVQVGTVTKVRTPYATVGPAAHMSWIENLSAGPHIISIQWKSSSGTAYNRAASEVEHRTLIVKEFLGGSSTTPDWFTNINAPKSTVDTPDDEFDSTTLDAKWNVVSGTVGTVTLLETGSVQEYDLITDPGSLLIQSNSSSVSMRQDYAVPDGKSIVMSISGTPNGPINDGDNMRVSMSLNDNDTDYEAGNYLEVGLEQDTGSYNIQAFRTGGTYTTLPQTEGVAFQVYVRIIRNGTKYIAFVSSDGENWTYLYDVDNALVFDNIWIYSKGPTAYNYLPIVKVDWIREASDDIVLW